MRFVAIIVATTLALASAIPTKGTSIDREFSSRDGPPDDSPDDPPDDPKGGGLACVSGTYQCYQLGPAVLPGQPFHYTESGIDVCNAAGQWVISAVCGGPMCCQQSGVQAWCLC